MFIITKFFFLYYIIDMVELKTTLKRMSQYVRSQQRLDCYNMILVRLLQNVLYWANNFLNRILTYDVLYELWAHGHFI